MIDDILSALDAPRSALWNSARGIANYATGNSDASWRDVVPGALGALGTAGLAATGVGLPAAILAGSVLGGAGQLASGRQAMSPGEFLQSHAGIDPESTGGALAGMLLGGATDPLSYAGAGLGKMLGRSLGEGAERTAQQLGPRYGTTAADLNRMGEEAIQNMPRSPAVPVPALAADESPELGRLRTLLLRGKKAAADTPVATTTSADGLNFGAEDYRRRMAGIPEISPQALGHIPPGSSLLGMGAEASAFKTPTGDVVRVGYNVAPPGVIPGRPISPNVAQATYARDLPYRDIGGSSTRVERVPMASNVKDPEYYAAHQNALSDALENEGLAITDEGPRNMGQLGGRPVAIDPGSVEDLLGFRARGGNFQKVIQDTGDPTAMSTLLERLLGGKARMQAAVESGRASPGYASQLSGIGAGLGGLGGAGAGNAGR